MLYIKALSNVEDVPAARERWGLDVTEYKAVKVFPDSYKELQEMLLAHGEYSVPIITPPLMEEYDWENAEYTVLLWLTLRREDGTWFHVLLSSARVFIMNSQGDTIDTINVI